MRKQTQDLNRKELTDSTMQQGRSQESTRNRTSDPSLGDVHQPRWLSRALPASTYIKTTVVSWVEKQSKFLDATPPMRLPKYYINCISNQQ